MDLSRLSQASISPQTHAIVRVDLNVPMKNGEIIDDSRLVAVLPTLEFLHKKKAFVTLITHIGKPTPEHPTPDLSTRKLIPWFKKHGFDVLFVSDIVQAIPTIQHPIILLENIRFFSGEKAGDQSFAKQLAAGADMYVNDAFAAIHRTDTSLTLLAAQFDKSKRFIGLAMERELEHLNMLKKSPRQPFLLVLGGAKLEDKVSLLEGCLSNPAAQRPKTIIIGGALALPFLMAQGLKVGKTSIPKTAVSAATAIIKKAAKSKVKLLFPSDFLIINGPLGAPTTTADAAKIPARATAVDIGPTTGKSFSEEIAKAKTIFANGPMGIYEQKLYQKGSKTVLSAIAACKGYTVIGGGDLVAAAALFKLTTKFSFVSTGGGATLALLATPKPYEQLPALKILAA